MPRRVLNGTYLLLCLVLLAEGVSVSAPSSEPRAKDSAYLSHLSMKFGRSISKNDLIDFRTTAVAPPFDDMQDYIASLERPRRADWQRPRKVVDALDFEGVETIVDLGAGSGYFAKLLAEQVPWGEVIALDTEPEMVDFIINRARLEHLKNLDAVLVDSTHPELPDLADIVFICNVLHYIEDPGSWMRDIAEQLQPNARLVVIGFAARAPSYGPIREHRIPVERVLEYARRAGLASTRDLSNILPFQFMIVFKKLSPDW